MNQKTTNKSQAGGMIVLTCPKCEYATGHPIDWQPTREKEMYCPTHNQDIGDVMAIHNILSGQGLIQTINIDDELEMYYIVYLAGEDCGPMSGHLLTGGRPDVINGQDVVAYKTIMPDGKRCCVRYTSRPALAALVAEYRRLEKVKDDAQQTKWSQQRAAQDVIDQPLLVAMDAEIIRLRSLIPTDHVEVIVTQTGDLDGNPILRYKVEGTEIDWDTPGLIMYGWASAIRLGALDSFARQCIASISRADLVAERTRQTQRRAAQKAKNEEYEKIMKTATPPCPYCGTYCEGDCGGKPGDETEDNRERDIARREMDYGIND